MSPGPNPALVLPSASDQRPGLINRALVSLRLRGADLLDAVTGRRDPLTPPRRLALYVGHGNFRETGDEFARLFGEIGGLQPTDRVLDIGCGIGRMARTLVPILRPPGSYDGFDIKSVGIDWCRAHYRDTPVPFRFAHADLHNEVYNPDATGDPSSFTFPYADGSFDFALATSVFTHLLPDAVERYLAESSRVLAPGGRLFATWFLFDDGDAPPEPFAADPRHAPAHTADQTSPEAAVAYPRNWVNQRLNAHGLEPSVARGGSWTGGTGATLQDIVIARPRRGGPRFHADRAARAR